MSEKSAVEILGASFEEFKKTNDQVIKEIKTKGAASAELQEKLEKIEKTLDASRDQVKAIETAMARGTRSAGGNTLSDGELKYKNSFNSFIRKGVEINAQEHKDLFSSSDPDGGYFVPAEMSAEIVKFAFETSPLRPLCSVQVISSGKFEIIEDLGQIESGWVGERQARPATDTSKLNKLIIEAHELYAKPLATQTLLDDSAVNIESWLAEKIAEKMGRDENTAFVSGDGVGKPKGFAAYAAGTSYGQVQQVQTAASLAISFDDIMDLQGSLKQVYRANASFGMKREVFTAVRKLKDLNGQYLWQPSLQAGQPDLILGKPVVELNDMASVAANSLSVVFADFRAGYQIVDRIGVRMLRDPYSSKPNVEFYATKRVGGSVKNFDSIKLLKVKA